MDCMGHYAIISTYVSAPQNESVNISFAYLLDFYEAFDNFELLYCSTVKRGLKRAKC